jgi:hypothetical protein
MASLSSAAVRWPRKIAGLMERPLFLSAIPAIFLALLLIGALRGYSPVPTYDMWEGALLGYFRLMEDGNPWEFLDFWNEHRIVLSKILFWLDTRYFGTRFLLLIAANIVLLVALWGALCAIARKLVLDRDLWQILCAGIAALSFSWLQRENVDSPFQSQFILAYLVPLLAFFAMANAQVQPARTGRFVAAVVLAAASLGTMANGLLVFPLLIGMQIVVGLASGRWAWGRLGIVASAGVVLTVLWFRDFSSPHGDRATAVDFVIFAATFLGFPFGYLTSSITGGIVGCAVFLALLVLVLHHAWRARTHLDPFFIGLLAVLAYVGGTCLLTAYGRAAINPNAALIGRYATPSLVGWACLLILLGAIYQRRANARRIFAATSIAVALVLFPTQFLRTIGDDGPTMAHGAMRAALAFKLGVPDLRAANWAFHTPSREQYDAVKTWSERISGLEGSIFADPMWDHVIAKIGTDAGTMHACKTHVDGVREIPGEFRFRIVEGWAMDEEKVRQPRFIYFAADGKIVGLALRGAPRPDVSDIIDLRGGYAGYYGYVLATNAESFTVVCPEGAL